MMEVFVWGFIPTTNVLFWKTTHAFTNSLKFPHHTTKTKPGVSKLGGYDPCQVQKAVSCSHENISSESHADKISSEPNGKHYGAESNIQELYRLTDTSSF